VRKFLDHSKKLSPRRLRNPHCIDNRLTDGSKDVSLTYRPRSAPRNISWYSFQLEAE
jgi:hypothetical protein